MMFDDVQKVKVCLSSHYRFLKDLCGRALFRWKAGKTFCCIMIDFRNAFSLSIVFLRSSNLSYISAVVAVFVMSA